MKEEKRIPGFEEYSITPEGKVYSYKRKERVEKCPIIKHGYYTVQFQKNGYPYIRSIAMLVANAFIPKPDLAKMIRHKDGDLSNNRVDNLEWVINEDRVRGYY